MRPSKDCIFKYFDPDWMNELTGGDQQMSKRIMSSFIINMPDLITSIQISANQDLKSSLFEAINKANSVSCLFTRHDLALPLTTLKTVEDGPIHRTLIEKTKAYTANLELLLREVRIYRSNQFDSQFGINIPLNIRNN